jgi:ribosome-associated protein
MPSIIIVRYVAHNYKPSGVRYNVIVIIITKDIEIPEDEIEYQAILSSGPGGQNVNKVATAIQLRFDVIGSSSLPEGVRGRLLVIARNRITKEGVLVIEANIHRSQEKNRQNALDRLAHLIKQAAVEPKKRVKARPTKKARQERLKQKRLKSIIKRLRSRIINDEY